MNNNPSLCFVSELELVVTFLSERLTSKGLQLSLCKIDEDNTVIREGKKSAHLIQMGRIIIVLLKKDTNHYDRIILSCQTQLYPRLSNTLTLKHIRPEAPLQNQCVVRLLRFFNETSRTMVEKSLINNFKSFLKFLVPKEILKLFSANSELWNYINDQETYQEWYEQIKGRTGFKVYELNWKTLLASKLKNSF